MKRSVNVLLAAMTAMLLAGCTAIGPNYTAPDRAALAGTAFVNAGDYDASEPLTQWWTLFGDENLNGLVALGLAENRTLGSALARVNAARAQSGLARLNRLPFDTVTGSYLQSRQGSAVFGASTGLGSTGAFPTNDLSDVNVSASWEIDLFGRVTRTINIVRPISARASRCSPISKPSSPPISRTPM